MMGDYSLSDLKNVQFSLTNSSQIDFDFFIVNVPMRPEVVVLITFVY